MGTSIHIKVLLRENNMFVGNEYTIAHEPRHMHTSDCLMTGVPTTSYDPRNKHKQAEQREWKRHHDDKMQRTASTNIVPFWDGIGRIEERVISQEREQQRNARMKARLEGKGKAKKTLPFWKDIRTFGDGESARERVIQRGREQERARELERALHTHLASKAMCNLCIVDQ